MKLIKFDQTISPKQGRGPKVICFTATPDDITKIARVDRIGRDSSGRLTGFQRPQISAHVREIRDYLSKPDAMLPNAIVLAFSDGVKIGRDGSLTIDISKGPPGWVVDGQQRLAAALGLPKKPFQFLVSAFLCEDPKDLNLQFILVNTTRPLSKTLIYELLPSTEGLPTRLLDRAGAALLTEVLNHNEDSALRGLIHQHTNPDGVLKDTLIQKLLLNSMQNGALRDCKTDREIVGEGYRLLNAFFSAVRRKFRDDWEGHTPKTSRLLHGVGILSMGYVMDEISAIYKAESRQAFERGLDPLIGKTHWTSGEWHIGSERRAWNSLQNTSADYRLLSHHLVRLVRRRISGKSGR